ncbi:hypothetical protein HNQ56_004430 [Anaerotaenia torta]|uniref:pyocin knob domain-containing protein n=1 Tax=Anaerotaenia torta TaxID=433293 RepID=UPI003D1C8BA1
MAEQTGNYGLIKPAENEYYDINVQNTNMDIIDTELKKQETDLDEIRENTETVSTSTLSQHKSIFSAGTGSNNEGTEYDIRDIIKGGQSKLKIKGFTSQNLIKNGDFSNGVTGWSGGGGTIAASNGTLIHTGNGSANYPYTQVISPHKGIVGHKYYISYLVRVTNNNCTRLDIRVPGIPEAQTIMNAPSANIWYSLGVIINALDTSSVFALFHIYADATTANGKVMEVKKVMCVDLTELFVAGNEPTKEQCDYIFDHYIDGLQGVGSHNIISVGKNLFSEQWRQGDWNNPSTLTRLSTNNPIFVQKGKTYYINTNSDSIFSHSIGLSDAKSGGILIGAVSFGVKTFTPPINCWAFPVLRKVTDGNISVGDIGEYKLQIEENTATDYEPYQSSEYIVSLPGVQMHRLPNGVCDGIKEVNGKDIMIRRTSAYTLLASDILTLYTEYSNLDYVIVELPSNVMSRGTASAAIRNASNKILTDKTAPADIDFINDVSMYWKHGYGESFTVDKRMIFMFPKGSYANFAAVQAAFVGTKIVYELAVPLVYSSGNNEAGFKTEGNLEVFEDGTVYQESTVSDKQCSNVIVDITYNLSDKAVAMANSAEFTALHKMINGKLKNSKDCSETGVNANVEGRGNVASGPNSHAGGYNSIAEGPHSFVHGQGLRSHPQSYDQAVFGRFNEVSNVDLLQVGAGTSEANRWNTLAVNESEIIQRCVPYSGIYTQTDLDNIINATRFRMNTWYRFFIDIRVSGLSLPERGTWLVEGHKSDDNYQWQIARRYGSGGIIEYRRAKNNGVWTVWESLNDNLLTLTFPTSATLKINSQEEFNNLLNYVMQDMPNGTLYRRVLSLYVVIPAPMNSGGSWLLEGFKASDTYQWQKITGYFSGKIYFRACAGGNWQEWQQIAMVK